MIVERVQAAVWQSAGRPPLVVAFAAAVAMLPVGAILTVAGLVVLRLAGGAAHDTALVVLVAALAATDFWAGGLLQAVTRRAGGEVVAPWLVARACTLIPVLVVALPRPAWGIVLSLAAAAPAAYAGARIAAANIRHVPARTGVHSRP